MDTENFSGPSPPDYRFAVDRIKNLSTLEVNNLEDVSEKVFDHVGPTLAGRLIEAACYILMGTECNGNFNLFNKGEKYAIDMVSDCFAKEYLSQSDPVEYAACITEYPPRDNSSYTVTITETNPPDSKDPSIPRHIEEKYKASLTMSLAPNCVTITCKGCEEVSHGCGKACSAQVDFDIDNGVEILGGK